MTGALISYLLVRLNTAELTKTQRPIAVLILAILTFFAIPSLWLNYLFRDPLEVSFRYPAGTPQPPSDGLANFAVTQPLPFAAYVLFIGCILAVIGILMRKKIAWYAVVSLLIAIVSLNLYLPVFYGDIRISTTWLSIAISGLALYVVFRKDVRTHIAVKKV